MELHHYIKELLFQHDCVIVPGFGGFVGNYKPAEVNYMTHAFSPPSKEIVFNAGLKENDGLLIGAVSRQGGMSYVDARNWIERQVKELTRKLEKGKKVYLDDIGTLHLGKEKNILFEPARSVNYLTDAYGLPDFQFGPLEQKPVVIPRSVTGKGASLKAWRWAAVAIPLAAILVLVPLKTNLLQSVNIDFSTLNPFKNKSLNPETVKEATPGKADKPIAVSEQDNTQIKSAEVPEQVQRENAATPVSPAVRYYIVAGSFRNPRNAESLKQQLAGEGRQPQILEGPGGFIRVGYGAFESKDSALRELAAAKREKGHEMYWVVAY